MNSERGRHSYVFRSGPTTGDTGETMPLLTAVLQKVNDGQAFPEEETILCLILV